MAWLAFAALAVPWIAVLTPIFDRLPGFRVSSFHWPVPALILLCAWPLRNQAPDTARRFGAGAAILAVSIAFRLLDSSLCEAVPAGAYFLWHLLNARLLGWMIEALEHASPALAGQGDPR